MRILIISFTFPPNKDGVSEAASAMARGFQEKGWQVSVLTEALTPPRLTTNWEESHIIEYDKVRTSDPKLEIHGHPEGFEKFITSGNWDTIIFHAYEFPLQQALRFLPRIRAKTILVSHGYGALIWTRVRKFPFGLGALTRSLFGSFRMIWWLPYFDRVVYLSEQRDFLGFYDHLIATMTNHPGIRVIPNGVDRNESAADPASFREQNLIPTSDFVFLCVANYSQRKDQGYAVRAFRRAAIPNSTLVFIGSEFNEYSDLFQAEDRKSSYGEAPRKIIWLEKQSRESTLNALGSCDAFVLSANHEAQPIAILEAMRAGKPWIARKAGCIESMEGGLCVRSESAMANAMRKIALEDGLRTQLSLAGSQAITTRYNRDAYNKAYGHLVEELAGPAS